MRRLPWWLAASIAFVLGAVAGGLARPAMTASQESARLEAELASLRARLHTAEAKLLGRNGVASAAAMSSVALGADAPGGGPHRAGSGAAPDGARMERADLPRPGSVDPRQVATAVAPPSAPARPSVDAAIERFYAYLNERNGSGPGRWQRMRQLVDDLRAMGDAGVEALTRVLAGAGTTEEQRLAAQLLGALKPVSAIPALQDVLDHSGDVLLRRSAATALRRLDSPATAPVLETLIGNPSEDRFVRMSAARGLAELGRPEGVASLVQIFDEANPDGRGRDMAFRSIRSLDDDRALPFMRSLVGSNNTEVSYRVDAIRFLGAHGDQQALPLLQQVMQTPTEQPSVRDAAAQAHAAIAAR